MTARKNVTGGQTGFTSHKAIENWPLPFIADHIDTEALNEKRDAMPPNGSLEDVRELLLSAVGYCTNVIGPL